MENVYHFLEKYHKRFFVLKGKDVPMAEGRRHLEHGIL